MSNVPDDFHYLRPDEVAECWDGVVRDGDWSLYRALWGLMEGLPSLDEQICIEDSSPSDAVGLSTLASVWDRLSPEHQEWLRGLVDRNTPHELVTEEDRGYDVIDPRLEWFRED